jgi:hypothetical protein
MVLIGVFFLTFQMTACIFGSGYDVYVNENIKPKNIKGRILAKYKEETGCFGAIIVEQNNTVDTLRKINYCTQPEHAVWNYILPDDSIYKMRGTLEVDIVRNGTGKKFTFPTRIP